MTDTLPRATLPAIRPLGLVRRLVIVALCAAIWVVSVVVMVAGFVPEIDGDETMVSIKLGFVVLGVALATGPVLLLWIPERRRVIRALDALRSGGVMTAGLNLPDFSEWAGPERMFSRLRWHAALASLIPLLTLAGLAAAFGAYLDEGAAGIICGTFLVVPLAFLVVTATVPSRLRMNLRAGLLDGQVIPLRVERRVDQQLRWPSGQQSWFDARLPDGQQVLLRTPVHQACDTDARGVVDSLDLVLVVGRAGHQAVLLDPSRPADAVWLLGPAPLTRAPHAVLRDLAEATAG